MAKNTLNSIIQGCVNKWQKEKVLMDHIWSLVYKHEIPCYIYKIYNNRYHIRPCIDTCANYSKHRDTLIIGTTGYDFKHNYLRNLDSETLDKWIALDNQKTELAKQQQDLLASAFKSNKKYTKTQAKQWEAKRQELLKEYGIIEE